MIEKLILGTVQFGLDYGINNKNGQMSEQEVFDILDLSKSKGISYLDTAAAYGNSEERIGSYIAQKSDTFFKIITKFDLKKYQSPIDSLNESLSKLNVSCVDTIMFHNYDDFLKTTQYQLEKLLEHKGIKFKKLGISVYTNEQIDEVCKTKIFQTIQMPFNALDNNNIRGEAMRMMKTNGIEIHTRSVFLQGLFFMPLENIPAKLEPLTSYLSRMNQISSHYQVGKSALALHYNLSNQLISGVLMGVDSVKQLEQNIALINAQIPQSAFDAIDEIQVKESSLLNPATWNQ
jgi:aryl-alcohol dehydrogenase-like predicted oxidoreductase